MYSNILSHPSDAVSYKYNFLLTGDVCRKFKKPIVSPFRTIEWPGGHP